MFLNRATDCRSGGQTLRLRADGSLAVNLRLAVCRGFLPVLLFFFLTDFFLICTMLSDQSFYPFYHQGIFLCHPNRILGCETNI